MAGEHNVLREGLPACPPATRVRFQNGNCPRLTGWTFKVAGRAAVAA
jgi:hypothetical protein